MRFAPGLPGSCQGLPRCSSTAAPSVPLAVFSSFSLKHIPLFLTLCTSRSVYWPLTRVAAHITYSQGSPSGSLPSASFLQGLRARRHECSPTNATSNNFRNRLLLMYYALPCGADACPLRGGARSSGGLVDSRCLPQLYSRSGIPSYLRSG